MIINRITPTQHSINNNYAYPTFKAYMPEKFYRHAEKCTFKVEKALRIALNNILAIGTFIVTTYNKIRSNSQRKTFDNKTVQINEEILGKIKANTTSQMYATYIISKNVANNKEVEINIENGVLEDLTKDNEACIFIMNHDKQKEDPKLLCFFNALLSREYLAKGMEKTCPKPKIIINKDILETTNKERQLYGEALGLVGIDAGIYCGNKFANGKIMSTLIKDFVENKANLFIFPEGRMIAFENLDPQWKFQPGIADIVRAATQKKEYVKVVPLGFAYKNDVGGINIGKPILFKKENNCIKFKIEESDKNFQDKKYIDFIENYKTEDGWYTITEKGTPVMHKRTGEFIAGILCENLTLSKKKAAESLKNVGTKQDNDTIYTLGNDFDE